MMAHETVNENPSEEPIVFGPAINDATMAEMEAGAASKERGVSRRYALLAMARDAKTLAKLSIENPKAYGEMRAAIDDYKAHAQALLEVAEAASFRMMVADCRESAPRTA